MKRHKKDTRRLVVYVVLIILFQCFFQSAEAQTETTFLQSDRFSIPQINGEINFAANGSYSKAVLHNDTWSFTNLKLSNISQPLGNLTIRTENSNVTILSYRSNNLFGRSGRLTYNVKGVGSQTVNLGLNLSQPTSASEWSVILPGSIFLAEGEAWKLLPDDSVVVTGITGNVSVVHYSYSVLNDQNLPFYIQHSIIILTGVMLIIMIAVSILIKFWARH